LPTNIEIDDKLLAEAMAATGLRTKRKVVEAGLRMLAWHKRQSDAPESCSAIFAGRRSRPGAL
jgi:Arc/MetJ family transcription regulator